MRLSVLAVVLLAMVPLGCVSSSSDRGGPRSDFEAREQDPPITADTHFAAGRLAEVQGDLNGAIAQYQAALKLEPHHLDSLYRLGVDYCALKRFPEAIESWKTYTQAAGGAAGGWSNLGFACELAGRKPEAEDAYRHGIIQDPRSVVCRVNYGLMLARADRIPEATQQLSAVLTPAEVHYNLASVYEQEARPAEARAEYEKALKIDPHFTDASAKLAALR